MSLSMTDQRELLIILHEGTASSFLDFLERFRRRIGAHEALLVERRAGSRWREQRATARDRAPGGHPDQAALLALRPGRVYGLTEIARTAGSDGRIIRSGIGGNDQWLIALDGAEPFGAADSVLMTNLAGHVSVACDNAARLEAARLDAAAAGEALRRAGVGWSLLNAAGGVIAGDATRLSPRHRAALAERLAEGERVAVAGEAVAVGLPADWDRADVAALALFRTFRLPLDRAKVFAATYCTSSSEARLAVALAEGSSIAEAAASLGLTVETARFYSKRLYAATGAKGQADLLRLFWTGPAALG